MKIEVTYIAGTGEYKLVPITDNGLFLQPEDGYEYRIPKDVLEGYKRKVNKV